MAGDRKSRGHAAGAERQEKRIGSVTGAAEAKQKLSPQADASADEALEKGTPGSTITAIYGDRRPMTYHLFETEMMSISALNGEALRYFSFGAFLLTFCLNILVAYVFSPVPVPLLGMTVLKYGIWGTGGLAVCCYLLGGWAIWTRHSLIERIKRETIKRT